MTKSLKYKKEKKKIKYVLKNNFYYKILLLFTIYTQRFLNQGWEKIPQSRIIKGSSLKDERRFLNQGSKKACSMKDQEIFPNQGSKKFFNQWTFARLWMFSSSKREIDYFHHKSKCLICLTTNQLETECLRELENSPENP